MSVRVDSSPLIASSVVIGDPGHGVLAENVPSTGELGAGYIYNELSFPADNGKEARGLITTAISGPDVIFFKAHEDTSFDLVVGADGTYTWDYEWFLDGVSQGTGTATIIIGAAIAVGKGSLTLAGKAPTVSTILRITVTPGKGQIAISGKIPTITTTGPLTITRNPGKGALSLTGKAPTTDILERFPVPMGKGALSLSGKAPASLIIPPGTVLPGKGDLTLTGKAPTVSIPGAAAARTGGGGGQKKHRRRKNAKLGYPRQIVIDGRVYKVSSPAEEREILEAHRKAAEARLALLEANQAPAPMVRKAQVKVVRLDRRLEETADREQEHLERLRRDDEEILLVYLYG